MSNKSFRVTIEFEVIELKVTAKNKTEARKKALTKLARKNPTSLIKRGWGHAYNKREIDVDEF